MQHHLNRKTYSNTIILFLYTDTQTGQRKGAMSAANLAPWTAGWFDCIYNSRQDDRKTWRLMTATTSGLVRLTRRQLPQVGCTDKTDVDATRDTVSSFSCCRTQSEKRNKAAGVRVKGGQPTREMPFIISLLSRDWWPPGSESETTLLRGCTRCAALRLGPISIRTAASLLDVHVCWRPAYISKFYVIGRISYRRDCIWYVKRLPRRARTTRPPIELESRTISPGVRVQHQTFCFQQLRVQSTCQMHAAR